MAGKLVHVGDYDRHHSVGGGATDSGIGYLSASRGACAGAEGEDVASGEVESNPGAVWKRVIEDFGDDFHLFVKSGLMFESLRDFLDGNFVLPLFRGSFRGCCLFGVHFAIKIGIVKAGGNSCLLLPWSAVVLFRSGGCGWFSVVRIDRVSYDGGQR